MPPVKSWDPNFRKGYGDDWEAAASQAAAGTSQATGVSAAAAWPLDCAMGTNPYGPSPKALTAFRDAVAPGGSAVSLHLYPRRGAPELASAVARRFARVGRVEPENVIVTASGDAGLELAAKAFLPPGGTVLGFLPQYPEFLMEIAVRQGVHRAAGVSVASGGGGNLASVARSLVTALKAVSPGSGGRARASAAAGPADLVFIDSPNNPTGQVMPLESVAEVAAAAAETATPVLVDEAYGDWLDDTASAVALSERYPNLVVLRSLSKGPGLADLRVGYLVARDRCRDTLLASVMPYPVGAAVEAAAREGLTDFEHLRSSRGRMVKDKAAVTAFLARSRNLAALPSHPETPILAVGLRRPDRHAESGRANLADVFLAHGLATAPGSRFPGLGPGFVRLRVGPEVSALLERLAAVDRSLTAL